VAVNTQISDREQQRLIDRYARWHLLRRLRQQAAAAGSVSQGAFLNAKQHTSVAIALLAWLHEHGTTLPDATQHHLDIWFAEGPTTRQHAARFVRWAIKQRLIQSITVTRAPGRTSPVIGEERAARAPAPGSARRHPGHFPSRARDPGSAVRSAP
jgi:hypothetical protein